MIGLLYNRSISGNYIHVYILSIAHTIWITLACRKGGTISSHGSTCIHHSTLPTSQKLQHYQNIQLLINSKLPVHARVLYCAYTYTNTCACAFARACAYTCTCACTCRWAYTCACACASIPVPVPLPVSMPVPIPVPVPVPVAVPIPVPIPVPMPVPVPLLCVSHFISNANNTIHIFLTGPQHFHYHA